MAAGVGEREAVHVLFGSVGEELQLNGGFRGWIVGRRTYLVFMACCVNHADRGSG